MKDKINPDYYTKGIQCCDYITSHKLNYLEGNIVKYVTRHKHKNKFEDLMKAGWYLNKLIQEEYNEEYKKHIEEAESGSRQSDGLQS